MLHGGIVMGDGGLWACGCIGVRVRFIWDIDSYAQVQWAGTSQIQASCVHTKVDVLLLVLVVVR